MDGKVDRQTKLQIYTTNNLHGSIMNNTK